MQVARAKQAIMMQNIIIILSYKSCFCIFKGIGLKDWFELKR